MFAANSNWSEFTAILWEIIQESCLRWFCTELLLLFLGILLSALIGICLLWEHLCGLDPELGCLPTSLLSAHMVWLTAAGANGSNCPQPSLWDRGGTQTWTALDRDRALVRIWEGVCYYKSFLFNFNAENAKPFAFTITLKLAIYESTSCDSCWIGQNWFFWHHPDLQISIFQMILSKEPKFSAK